MRLRTAGAIVSSLAIALWAGALAACSSPVEGSSGGATGMDSTDSSDGDSEASSAANSSNSSDPGATTGGASSPSGSGSGASDSSTSADPSTSAGAMECEGVHQLELDADDAELSGGWELGWSNYLDREVIRWEGGDSPGPNAVVFHPEIPCADDWWVWVLFRDVEILDSFFVQSDGAPDPPAIFDGHCDWQEESQWRWNDLNRREPGAMDACVYAEDPWTQAWDAGVHELRFSFRESSRLGPVIITNDPNFEP